MIDNYDMKITQEMAEELGYIPSCLPSAYRAVEKSSILSPATGRAFESAYREARKQRAIKYGIDKNFLVEVPNHFVPNLH